MLTIVFSFVLRILLILWTEQYRTLAAVAKDAAGSSATSPGVTVTVSASATALVSSGGSGMLYPNVGWTALPNTAIQNYCPDYSVYSVRGGSDCGAVVFDWSSAWNDTKRNRMVLWGGGHGDYHGNEIYTLDIRTGKMARATNPSVPWANCSPTNADGTPSIRHTYDTMVYVGGTHDYYYQWGGAMNGCGFTDDHTYTLQPDLKTWSITANHEAGTGFPVGQLGVGADYDSITDRIYMIDIGSFGYFDAKTNEYRSLSTMTQVDYHQTCGVDHDNRLFVCVGANKYYKWDLKRANPVQQVGTLSGCGAAFTSASPYMAYYRYRRQFALWAGGNGVFLLDAKANSCTTVNFAGGPTQINACCGLDSKLFGYYPDLGVFALVTNIPSQNAYILRLDAGAGGCVPASSATLEIAPMHRVASICKGSTT